MFGQFFKNVLCSKCQKSHPYSIALVICPKNPSKSEACHEFCDRLIFYGKQLLVTHTTRSWRTALRGLSMTAYSVYLQLPSIVGVHPHHPQHGDEGPTNVALLIIKQKFVHFSNLTCYLNFQMLIII